MLRGKSLVGWFIGQTPGGRVKAWQEDHLPVDNLRMGDTHRGHTVSGAYLKCVQMKGDAAGGVTSLQRHPGPSAQQDEPTAKETAAPAPTLPRRSGCKNSGLGLKQATRVSSANGGPFQGWKLRERRGDGETMALWEREADRSRRLCLCPCLRSRAWPVARELSCCVPGSPVVH